MVAIARGVSLGAKVLVLDEPTSSLTEKEVGILFDVIGRLKKKGTAIVYISHRFEELYAVCDRVTVLRDGKLVGTRNLAGLERIDLVCMMLGKQREELEKKGATAFGEFHQANDETVPLLQTRNLNRGRSLRNVSIEARHGEILGMAGLLGSGRTDVARAIFGADPLDDGKIYMNGNELKLHSPSDAINAGIAFLSEDRKAEGIIPEWSVRENLTLAALPSLTSMGVVSRTRQNEIVDKFIKRLGIKTSGPDQKIRELSGGNQQKVLLARWLCKNPKFMIMDEPTRGIDVGAKVQVQNLVGELADNGLSVVFISAELEEVLRVSQRVAIVLGGRIVDIVASDEMSVDSLTALVARPDDGDE
jgi:ribose transport system ATP-binding protein